MDKLNDVATVKSTLSSFKTAVTNLKNMLNDLNANKKTVDGAWESDNADQFIAQYSSLINSLTEAFNGLDGYQQKIDAVVQEFVGFDETIN